MELDVYPGSKIINPTREQINDVLEKVFLGEISFTTLVADEVNQRFIQAMVGGHVEYKEGKSKIIYAAEKVSLETCQDMFWDYVQKGSHWKKEVVWHPQTIDKQGIKTDWETLSAETLAWEVDPQYEMVKPLIRQYKMTRKKSIPVIVIAVILTCGLCAFSVYLYGKLESSQFGRIAAESAFVLVWTCLAGIGWSILHTEKVFSDFKLYLQLIISILSTAGMVWISATAMGILSAAFFSGLLSGLFVIFFAARNLRNKMQFQRSSIEVECAPLSIHHYWETRSSEYGTSSYPVHILGFVYLQKYKDFIQLTEMQLKEYSLAIKDDKLHVFARYLPQKPKVHTTRFEVIQGK